MRERAIDTESLEEVDEDMMKGLGAGCYSQQACKQYTQSQWERGGGGGGRFGV